MDNIKDTTNMTYGQLARFQNMSVARTKAIEIMESIGCLEKLEGEAYYEAEDTIEAIISLK